MKFLAIDRCRRVSALFFSMALVLGFAVAEAQVLEEIVVTAQKREVGLQSAPIAISALTGEDLAKNRIFSVDDLAGSVASLALTGGNSPVDLELNIRGITNTRLDSPSGEAAVGMFLDEIYIGRNGGMNTDFYDIERVEVIRGPQGVLLGKSVVGGALSIITAKPEFESSGSVTVGAGNYDSRFVSGYVTGGFSDTWAGRFSFQGRQNDGYAKDVLHDRRLDNLESIQFRAQLLYQPQEGGWSGRLVVDYNEDKSNGINVVAVSDGQTGGFRPRPWSQMRAFLGLTDPYESVPEATLYAGNNTPVDQYLDRESAGLMLNIEKDFDGFALTSITGYRDARADNHYDQTGGGPDIFDDPSVFGVSYADFLAFNPTAATFFFSEPVNEEADISAFSQEVRLASTSEGRFDWILGLYYKRDEIDKIDRFVGENISGALAVLSGESHWYNYGDITNFAAFGQLGWQLADTLKVKVGLRWTSDKKGGDNEGVQVLTGDRFNPDDTVPLTPLQGPFATDYGATWKKATPQATLEYTPNDDLFLYATVSTGFKGGYFQDTPNSAFAARFPTRPEEVINYELGVKSDFADGRVRFNGAAFFMDYTDLQVEQTNQDCLCNLTENAADAEIMGVEAELTIAAGDRLLVNISGSLLDTEYVDFVESSGVDSSGNPLQRTPESQFGISVDYTMNVGQWGDALNVYLGYNWQDKLPWQPANLNFEDSYGLLNGRITLAPEDAPWSVSVWGKNITDELYRTNIIPFFGEEVGRYGPPATYGVEVRYAFN